MCFKNLTIYLYLAIVACSTAADCGPRLKYAWGDALQGTDCAGPDGSPYPRHLVNRAVKTGPWGQTRQARGLKTLDPALMRRALLDAHQGYAESRVDVESGNRTGRGMSLPSLAPSSATGSCGGARLCRSRYNTTAPMYGVSLTSGQPVTIVQKFPDLLQQVVFEVCDMAVLMPKGMFQGINLVAGLFERVIAALVLQAQEGTRMVFSQYKSDTPSRSTHSGRRSSECSLVRGSCTQTYIPYLFLVLPLGPVTLTGQDYVLVESGCVCRPDPIA